VSDAATRLSNALADRYRVERELGAGGMATVYLAEDLKHHRPGTPALSYDDQWLAFTSNQSGREEVYLR